MSDAKNYVFLVLANVFWAGNFVVGGLLADSVDPLFLTTVRWAIATLPLFVLAHLMERPHWPDVFREWPRLLVLAVLGLIGYGFLTYLALSFTDSTSASLLNAVSPALIAVGAVLISRERLRRTAILGLAVSLLGVVLVLVRLGDGFSLAFGTGELIMTAAVLTWVTYTVAGRTVRSPVVSATAVQSLIATAVLVPVALVVAPPLPAAAQNWWGILFIAVFPSVLSYLMWNVGIRGIGAARGGVFLNLLPFFAAIAGLFVGQPITVMQVVGGVVIVLGVVMVSRPRRTPRYTSRNPAAEAPST
ncbi:DMT family transporter [Brevibacterium litoralis]|uniref:DMT family transporter n=1 Tax=Brevibacterium litoralis TaxID=3138935 RepID=UPI0032EB3812